jgi:tRNA-modifying protein YgfZ
MMNSEWRTFLHTQGAQFSQMDWVNDFGTPIQEQQQVLQTTVMVDLSHYGLIQAQGEEAHSFLQGQFTNDVRAMDEKTSHLSAWCNSKGRIISSFTLFKRHNAYCLLLPKDRVTGTLQRLQGYVLRSKVTLHQACDEYAIIGISGEQSASVIINGLGVEPPTEDHQVVTTDAVTVIKMVGIIPRYVVIAHPGVLQGFWQHAHLPAVSAHAWQLVDILSGYPQVTQVNTEVFVPQMLNYDLLNGIHFKKGCYTGQEIVARLHYLGQLKQRLFLGHIDCEFPPNIHAKLHAPDQERSVGEFVAIQPHPRGGYSALAVVEIAYANDASLLRLNNANKDRFMFKELPYQTALNEAIK